jgi:hypothetical protein
MESTHSSKETDLVRCLDCSTVYSRPVADDVADPCPTCGYVGWIALKAVQQPIEDEDS